MDENEQKQQLSIAYLHAVASAAGFACQAPGVDDDSVDRTLVARGWVHEKSVLRSPKMDVQLKSITSDSLKEGKKVLCVSVEQEKLRRPPTPGDGAPLAGHIAAATRSAVVDRAGP